MKRAIGVTGNGCLVFDRVDSHWHPEGGLTRKKLREALQKVRPDKEFHKFEVSMGRIVGNSTCVALEDGDDVVMVRRLNRAGNTPMVINRVPEPSDVITVILKQEKGSKTDNYILVTAFIGGGSTREPWDKSICSDEEQAQCEEFWATHALIFDPALIDWHRTSLESCYMLRDVV